MEQEYCKDRFCDANCTWSDHHVDCVYGKGNFGDTDTVCTCAARSENECCCIGVDWRSEREKTLEAENTRLYCLIDDLRDAVRKYGRHDQLCAMVGGYGYCNCGLYDHYPPQGT